jgi:cobalt-zinc-cadmium resistance protein CzcA
MLCDGSIVVTESILARMKSVRQGRMPRYQAIFQAVMDVYRPVIFSGMIVIIVFLPLMTLEGIEGKMFAPMAFTISAGMLGSIVAALFFIPGLAMLFIRVEAGEETSIIKWLQRKYRPLLKKALRRSRLVIIAAVTLFFAAITSLAFIGTEFMPVLEEGSIFIGVTMAPSISLNKATELVMKLEKQVIEFTEVEEVISRVGRPEAGSHPHPVNYGEIQIKLKPASYWQNFSSKNQLIEAINSKLEQTPGINLNFTQPIQNAFDELVSGVKSQLAIKVYGEDLQLLQKLAEQINLAIENTPGLTDLAIEQSFGQPQVQVVADRESCARHGISVDQVLEMVELAVGGETIGNIFINNRRFAINLRYQEQFRDIPETIESLMLTTVNHSLIPLGQVARIKKITGPMQINRENNHRRWIVQGNIRGRDLGSVVAEIKETIATKVKLPAGYTVEFGGQFANQQRAMLRLSLIVPLAVAGVFMMLWLSFSSIRYAMIIFTMVPLSIIGGIFGLIVMQQYLSVPASIGCIALFGMAMLDGMVMVSCFNELQKQGMRLQKTIMLGSINRLAPVLITTLTTLLGLLPLLLASGAGSEIQRPLASVVVFGLLSSTMLTLFVIPAVYYYARFVMA